MKKEMKKIIEHYKEEGAAKDQALLVEMLKETQKLYGGLLKESTLKKICEKLDIKKSYLKAAMKEIPDLRLEKEKHKLKICGGKKCMSSGNEELKKYIKKTYDVKEGEVSEKGSFSYKVCGCMKKCKDGPCVEWDGKVHTGMTPKKLDKLIEG